MSDRPTCCERARETEALSWWTEADWKDEGAQDTRPGWRIVSGFAWGDKGKTEPEYERADFCPFCGGNPGRIAGIAEDLRILLNAAREVLKAHGKDPSRWSPMAISAGLRDLAAATEVRVSTSDLDVAKAGGFVVGTDQGDPARVVARIYCPHGVNVTKRNLFDAASKALGTGTYDMQVCEAGPGYEVLVRADVDVVRAVANAVNAVIASGRQTASTLPRDTIEVTFAHHVPCIGAFVRIDATDPAFLALITVARERATHVVLRTEVHDGYNSALLRVL